MLWCLLALMRDGLSEPLPSPDLPSPTLPPSPPPPPPRFAFNPPPDPRYASAFEEDTLAHASLPSSVFAPMVVRDCTHLTPAWFAPCVALRAPFSDQTYGEELVYPDFGLPVPLFAKEEHAERWQEGLRSIADRAIYRDGYVVYKSQHGQNFVVSNVVYTPEGYLDTWNGHACTGPNARLGDLKLDPAPPMVNTTRGTALVVNSPDSWSFQHWLDRAAHVIAQSAHLTRASATALTGKRGNELVEALWHRIGYSDVVHRPETQMTFDALVFSCKAVLIHPFLSWRALELLQLPFIREVPPSPPASKTTVLYMSRSDGSTANAGRNVLNEPDVIAGVESLLQVRDRGETLAHWSNIHALFEHDLDGLINYMWRNVSAVIGPHGGALINHRFAGPGTMVLGFLPTTHMSYLNYEETSMLNQTYAAIVVDPAGQSVDDMMIDPADVTVLLNAHLGKPRRENLVLSYQWDRE
ncbi:unnamed protein product [Cutaneotrichosporon oleaginosum]